MPNINIELKFAEGAGATATKIIERRFAKIEDHMLDTIRNYLKKVEDTVKEATPIGKFDKDPGRLKRNIRVIFDSHYRNELMIRMYAGESGRQIKYALYVEQGITKPIVLRPKNKGGVLVFWADALAGRRNYGKVMVNGKVQVFSRRTIIYPWAGRFMFQKGITMIKNQLPTILKEAAKRSAEE
jgi:hypothetical protein